MTTRTGGGSDRPDGVLQHDLKGGRPEDIAPPARIGDEPPVPATGRGHKIIDGIKDAIAGNFAAVTIEGQRWAPRDPAREAAIREMVGALVESKARITATRKTEERRLGVLISSEPWAIERKIEAALAAARSAGIEGSANDDN